MKISTKGRYALRMLVDLAEHGGGSYISLKEIAERQGISKKYLEQITPILHQSGLLRANRGAQGGYRLAKSPAACTVGEILRLTEGSLAPLECAEDPSLCARSADCATLPVWQGLGRVVSAYLDSVTLQDIVDQHRLRGENDYVI